MTDCKGYQKRVTKVGIKWILSLSMFSRAFLDLNVIPSYLHQE